MLNELPFLKMMAYDIKYHLKTIEAHIKKLEKKEKDSLEAKE